MVAVAVGDIEHQEAHERPAEHCRLEVAPASRSHPTHWVRTASAAAVLLPGVLYMGPALLPVLKKKTNENTQLHEPARRTPPCTSHR